MHAFLLIIMIIWVCVAMLRRSIVDTFKRSETDVSVTGHRRDHYTN